VLAAFECKLTLTSAHVRKAAQTSRIIHSLAGQREGTPYVELVSPIGYGLLAHKTALTRDPEDKIDGLLGLDEVEPIVGLVDDLCPGPSPHSDALLVLSRQNAPRTELDD